MTNERDQIQQELTKAYKKAGAFFAFNDKQFNEQKAPDLTSADYTHVFAGLICPKNTVDQLIKDMRLAAPAKR